MTRIGPHSDDPKAPDLAFRTMNSPTCTFSLTSIPERFGNVKQCIESLLEQSYPVSRIILNIPYEYKRLGVVAKESDLPKISNPKVIINRCSDYGPGTKLLGSIGLMESDMIVMVDDDMTYHENFLKCLVQGVEDENSAASFHVYQVTAENEHRIGQGADGFAIPRHVLDGIDRFYAMICHNHHLFLNDDLWVSFFLEMRGVRINDVSKSAYTARALGGNNAREEISPGAVGLVDIKGRFARWRSIYRGIRYLERKRPWLEAEVGIRSEYPAFSFADKLSDLMDLIRR